MQYLEKMAGWLYIKSHFRIDTSELKSS